MSARITTPTDPAFDALTAQLRDAANDLDSESPDEFRWPADQLAACGRAAVFEWFLPQDWGGQGWSVADTMRGYVILARACLTTTFVITQRTGACRRIAGSSNDFVKQNYLPGLVTGDVFATVGISHLTTSRRHLAKPVLRAEETTGGFIVDGFSPWVTGAAAADLVVTGATLADGRQLLAAVPTDLPGITVPPPARLVGLSASQTGPVEFERVQLEAKWLLAGPIEGVMSQGGGANTGGLQTSALALGLASAAIEFLEQEGDRRDDLIAPAESLSAEWGTLKDLLIAQAEGDSDCSLEELRRRANSLVLRSCQAALTAAKGSGYLRGHPVGRWCQEALFFLVWSCPQPVLAANLCELAGIRE